LTAAAKQASATQAAATQAADPQQAQQPSPTLAYAYIVGSGDSCELQALQLKRLNQTLEWARQQSRHYRQKLPARRLASLDELQELPLMSACDLQSGYQDLLCVQASTVSRMVTLPTSGTTGQAKRVAFSADDHAATVNYFAAGMRMLAGEGEGIAVLFPCERPAGLGQLLCESVELAVARAIPYGIPQSFRQMSERFHLDGVRGAVGFPQQLLAFSRLCEHNSICQGLSLRNLILTADNVAASLRLEIERIWGGLAFAHFGMTETGYGGAVECPAHQGLHVRESDLIFEIIDPLTLAPQPKGQWGELVFTTLSQQAMPFVRYRSGDYTRILPGQCSCGSALMRIDNVKGRRDEYVQVLGHSFGMPELEEPLFAIPGLLDFKAGFDPESSLLQLSLQLLPDSLANEAEIIGRLCRSQPFDALLGNELISVKLEITEQTDFAPYYLGKRRLLHC
jgi:phenylacetate-coenzyme A ligase PaaK-like adenylate-forming protein